VVGNDWHSLRFLYRLLSRVKFSLTPFFKSKNSTSMALFCFCFLLLLFLLFFSRKRLALFWLTGYLRIGHPARTETNSAREASGRARNWRIRRAKRSGREASFELAGRLLASYLPAQEPNKRLNSTLHSSKTIKQMEFKICLLQVVDQYTPGQNQNVFSQITCF